MNNRFIKIVGAVSGLYLLSGCVVIRDTTTAWEESRDPLEFKGPGAQDAALYRYENDKFEQDSGKRIAIGMFPGFAMAWDEKSYPLKENADLWKKGRRVTVDEYIGGETVGWLAFGMPFLNTISSLLVAPFCETESSILGLIGCHRWRSKASGRSLIKVGEREDIVEAADGSWRRKGVDEYTEAPAKLSDGISLRYSYPGYGVVLSDVENFGQVAVMFDRGSKAYRKFKKSECVKDALTYEDVAEGADAAADQLIWRRRLEIATNDIAMIVSSKELSLCSESYSNQVFEIEKEVANSLNAGCFVARFVLAKQDAISSLRESIKRESEIVAKVKQLNGLMAQKEYGDVLAAKSDGDTDERLLAVYKEAETMQEELRVVNKLKEAKDAYDRGDYQSVLKLVANETDMRFVEISKKSEDALKKQEEERSAAEKRLEDARRKRVQEKILSIRKKMDEDPRVRRASDTIETQIALFRTRGKIPAWMHAMWMAGVTTDDILNAGTAEERFMLLCEELVNMESNFSKDKWLTFRAEAWDLPF